MCLNISSLVRRGEELQEEWHSVRVHNRLGLQWGARGDVGECPGGLKLQRRVVVACQAIDEHGKDARLWAKLVINIHQDAGMFVFTLSTRCFSFNNDTSIICPHDIDNKGAMAQLAGVPQKQDV